MLKDSEIERKLVEIYKLLSLVEEKNWSSKIKVILKKINENKPIPPKEILSWYGGIGSFNDVMISAFNGHKIVGDENEFREEN